MRSGHERGPHRLGAPTEQAHDEAIRRNYLIRFEEDTLRQRPLWIRVIIEFVGTAALVLVAAGSGVINQYVAGTPDLPYGGRGGPRGPGHGADLRLGPAVGAAHQPGRHPRLHRPGHLPEGVGGALLVAQLAGAVAGRWFLQLMFGHVAAGRELPGRHPGRDLAVVRDGDRAHRSSW